MSDELTTDVAVVIGIEDYVAGGLLETPVADAKAIAALLQERGGYEVILRCDGEATRDHLCTLLPRRA